MLKAGLVDEISQVIVPIVDGGGSQITGFFDPPGKPAPSAAANLRLIRQKTLRGGAHWFRYRVEAKAETSGGTTNGEEELLITVSRLFSIAPSL